MQLDDGHLDDDAPPAERDHGAQRFEKLEPDEVAFAVVEFGGMADLIVAKAMRFGQGRTAFLVSMANAWDMAQRKFDLVLGQTQAQRQPPPAPPPPEPPAPAEGEG